MGQNSRPSLHTLGRINIHFKRLSIDVQDFRFGADGLRAFSPCRCPRKQG